MKRSRDGARSSRRVAAALLPILAVVLSAFLVTGLAMPVLPLHIHEDLGLGAFVVGLVAGAQFAAALLTRRRRRSRASATPVTHSIEER